MEGLLLELTRPSIIRPLLLTWMTKDYDMDNYFQFTILLDPRTSHVRPAEYYEDWLTQYIEYDFFQLFRMTQGAVERLLRFLGPVLQKTNSGGQPPIPAKKKVFMALWYLGKEETYISVSDKFNVAQSAAHMAVNEVIEEMVLLRHIFIMWPKNDEVLYVMNSFEARGNIPGVVGAMDVCNVEFKPPADQHDSYTDRKQNNSIKLQAICTANKIITNIVVGWPGSVHDSRIFQNSEIYRKVNNNIARAKFFPTLEHHLVADSAYPLSEWTLTPFRDNGNLAPWQLRYNHRLSQTRMVIEHVFGILKGRWRILQFIMCTV